MADRKRRANIDLPQILQSKGINPDSVEILSVNEEGVAEFKEKESGKVGRFNPRAYLESQVGGDVDKFEINPTYNTPDTAVQEFPKKLQDKFDFIRLKTKGLGNVKGSIKRLQKEFGEGNVSFSEKNGIVLKENGQWKPLDPSSSPVDYIKDPWEFARDVQDLAGEAILFAGEEAGGLVGRAAGLVAGKAGGTAGDISGSAVGAGIAEKFRQSLGRIVGTYEATEEEAMQDVATEMMFSAGGQALGLGLIPGAGRFLKATKGLKQGIDDTSKAVFSKVVGFLNGTGESATREIIENGPDITRKIRSSVTKGKAQAKRLGEAAATKSAREQGQLIATQEADTALKTASQEFLSKRTQDYSNGITKIGLKANKANLSIDFNNVTREIRSGVEQVGLGRYVKGRGGKLKFEPNSAQEIERAIKGVDPDLDVPALDAKTIKKFKDFGQALERFQLGTLKGRAASKQLINLNQSMNSLLDGIDPLKQPNMHRILTTARTSTQNKVMARMPKDLAADFAEVNAKYANTSQAAQLARRVKNGDGVKESQKVLEQFFGQVEKQEDAILGVQSFLANNTDAGIKAFREAAQWETAKRYIPVAPKMGLVQTGTFAAALPATGGAFLASGPVGAGVAAASFAPVALASTPRAGGAILDRTARASRGIDSVARGGAGVYSKGTEKLLSLGSTMARLTPEQTKRLVQDEAFPALIRELMNQGLNEETDQTLEFLKNQGLMENEQ